MSVRSYRPIREQGLKYYDSMSCLNLIAAYHQTWICNVVLVSYVNMHLCICCLTFMSISSTVARMITDMDRCHVMIIRPEN